MMAAWSATENNRRWETELQLLQGVVADLKVREDIYHHRFWATVMRAYPIYTDKDKLRYSTWWIIWSLKT